jgi:hypothetical protein
MRGLHSIKDWEINVMIRYANNEWISRSRKDKSICAKIGMRQYCSRLSRKEFTRVYRKVIKKVDIVEDAAVPKETKFPVVEPPEPIQTGLSGLNLPTDYH